jgi:adenine deaminase
MVRRAVELGVSPEDALVVATLNPATWHRLDRFGAVAPGYQADLLLLPDLERFEPETVLKRGRPVGEIERPDVPEWVKHTVRVRHPAARDFTIPWDGGRKARVIGVVPGQIVTDSLVDEPVVVDGLAVADPERDLAKIAVVERHLGTGRLGLGLVRGFGLRTGALASTVAHDAHNIVVVGVDDHDMARAVRRLSEIGGGVVVVEDGGVRAELALPIAGLLSEAPLDDVVAASRGCIEAAAKLGCELESPFQQLAFLALSVIPSLKITDAGLVDVDRFELVPLRV